MPVTQNEDLVDIFRKLSSALGVSMVDAFLPHLSRIHLKSGGGATTIPTIIAQFHSVVSKRDFFNAYLKNLHGLGFPAAFRNNK